MKTFCALMLAGLCWFMLGCESSDDPSDKDQTTSQEKTPSGENPSPAQESPPETAPSSPEEPIKAPPQYLWSGTMPDWLTPERVHEGWISLFDGETVFGWRRNSKANWAVQDGVLTASSGEQGLLLTPVPFQDFEFRCDFRLEQGGNSGVFLRTAENPTNPAIDCYELNICDTHPSHGTGSFVARAKTTETITSDGEWNTFHVVFDGHHLTVNLNGKLVLDFVDDTENFLTTGYIGLQYRENKIEFKNIFLRPLNVKPLISDESLSGWRVVPGSKAKFEVSEPGTIQATGGEGYLETEDTFGNFLLQAQAKTHSADLNSGIFFRAQPGTETAMANGYEVQIHNGIEQNDPQLPANWGTGAIFRRVPARHVNAKDNEWLNLTLVAYGPRIMTWVNGLCVVSWLDQREPSENPREGLRIEPGHLSLQAHDPTTDILFRNLQIEPLGDLPGASLEEN